MKDLLAALTALALSLLLTAALIPLLKRVGARQNILSYVTAHRDKQGTPTMGGIAFFLAASLAALLFARRDKPFFVALAMGAAYLFVGFLDDLLKSLRGKNLGLRAYQKLLFQLAVALLAGIYCCREGLTVLRIPYTTFSADIGWWMLPLSVLVFLATTNAVNLTDGLDGLAGSVAAVSLLFLGLLIRLQGGEGTLAFALAGALAGFLVFNVNRASLFMGDTGSLSLGGFLAALALLSGNALVLPLVGVPFVLSCITVIMQVIYYKAKGKRIFLMAPIHHHFQMKGYTEAKIAYGYALLSAAAGATLLLPFLS